MPERGFARTAFLTCGLILVAGSALAQAVNYDIVYVRQPRYGDNQNTVWPEVFHPAWAEPGADLMLLHPNGSEEVLVNCTDCAVTDPYISFDGQSVYYSVFHDMTDIYSPINGTQKGADIYRMNLATRQITQLTFGEFTPNTGAGNWDPNNSENPGGNFNGLGYRILNLGPCPLPGGKIAFTSNRNGFDPPREFTEPTMQLFVMDEDGSNIRDIAPMSINSALHPTILKDGRIMFSSYESQGIRDRRLWGLWSIYPDGRNWGPLASAFTPPAAYHFMTQAANEDILVVLYYNLNNNGFGPILRFPASVPQGTPGFHSPFANQNPDIWQTRNGSSNPNTWSMSFMPWGLYQYTPMTHHIDEAAPVGNGGVRVGKFTTPSQAPAGNILVTWTPGPANDLNRPTPLPYYDGGIYLSTDTVWGPEELIEIKNDPNYNEAWARAVVPYSDIFGVEEPVELPWLPNDASIHPDLPEGTPYGLVGTSSIYKRESFPGFGVAEYDGLDPFNSSQSNPSANWKFQGADAGKYSNSEIWAIRLLAMEPSSDRNTGPNAGQHFRNHANERLRILGEVPLRKTDGQGNPIMDPEGNPDTSFLVRIPADTPFTFQTLDRNGVVLNMAQTWHQLRPGEMRVDCGGCHSHSQTPLFFEDTAAGQPGFPVVDLANETPLMTLASGGGDPGQTSVASGIVDVEFYQDIRPILQSKCVSCHSGGNADGNLNLNDLSMYDGLPGDYKRLADDEEGNWGYPPLIAEWRNFNASRYVRMFQSRRSLLTWKIYGQRLDGWTNADHPTESDPGNPNSLPNGASANDADIDYTGAAMPPPGSPQLTDEEKITIARWIDLGAPINTGEGGNNEDFGWFMDEIRPSVNIHSPRAGLSFPGEIDEIRVGVADANTGLRMNTFSITASFNVNGNPPGAELKNLAFEESEGVWVIPLNDPIGQTGDDHVYVEIEDIQGNLTKIDQRFNTIDSLFADGFESGDFTRWDNVVD